MKPDYGSDFLKKVAEVEVRMKQIIKEGVFAGLQKETINARLLRLIKAFAKDIPDDYRDKKRMIDSLLYTRKELYNQLITTTQSGFLEAKTMLERMLGVKIKNQNEFLRQVFTNIHLIDSSKVKQVEQVKAENIWVYEQGYPIIKDYYEKLRKAVETLAESPLRAKYKGKSLLSLRSLSEMKLRHEWHQEQLAQFKSKGVNYVMISTHADCSERCEPWQGRLYSLDGTIGTLNGLSYVPLETATEAVDDRGNVNGLFGYNCRHRMIEYVDGMNPPMDYTHEEMEEDREVNSTQRGMEREIFRLKEKAVLLGKDPLATQYRKKATELTEQYKAYSEKHGRAWYEGRITLSQEYRNLVGGL